MELEDPVCQPAAVQKFTRVSNAPGNFDIGIARIRLVKSPERRLESRLVEILRHTRLTGLRTFLIASPARCQHQAPGITLLILRRLITSEAVDLTEQPGAESADACVRLIQQQMSHVADELTEGQTLEVIVPLANGSHVVAASFAHYNPEMIKVMGSDAEGNEVSLLMHKNALQVLIKKVANRSAMQHGSKPEDAFQTMNLLESKTTDFGMA